MKVLFQTEALNYKIKAGLHRYVNELKHEIAKHDSEKCIYIKDDAPAKRANKLRIFIENLTANRLLYGDDYDLCHITAMHYEPVRARKYCATIHDLIVYSHPEYFRAMDRFLFRKYFEQLIKMDGFICVSETTATELMRRFSVSHKKIQVIYEGCANKIYKDPDQQILLKYNIDKPFILFCSTIEPRKNLRLLLRAFIQGGFAQNYNLVIVGKIGWQSEELAHELSKIADVKHVGYVDDDDIRKLYSLAEVYVNPSHVEGFGLPIVEALKCGTKVLCSDISIFREIGGNHVRFFNPIDVVDLIKNLRLILESKSDFEKPGKEYFNKFSWSNTAINTLAYYKRLVSHV
jgi:glycosyltransferase involved in cell wall biosynthesis